MEWISVKDQLPIPKHSHKDYYSIGVMMAWGPNEGNVSSGEYVKEMIRGQYRERFKWHGKIAPWNITHWMPLPEPPTS